MTTHMPSSLPDAIRTKVNKIDWEMDSAYRTEWNRLLDCIKPQDRRSIRKHIESLQGMTGSLIKAKAQKMVEKVKQIIEETKVQLQGQANAQLTDFVLRHFEDGQYLKHFPRFIAAMERKFGGMGMAFSREAWGIDQTESIFNIHIGDSLHRVRRDIKAEFALLAHRPAAVNASPAPTAANAKIRSATTPQRLKVKRAKAGNANRKVKDPHDRRAIKAAFLQSSRRGYDSDNSIAKDVARRANWPEQEDNALRLNDRYPDLTADDVKRIAGVKT